MTILKRCPWASLRNAFTVSVVGKANGNNYSVCADTRLNRRPPAKLPHTPVLTARVVEYLQPEKCDVLVDMTFGAGGHTRKLLEKSPTVKILCLDRDPLAHSYAESLQSEYPHQVVALRGKFSDLPALLQQNGYSQSSLDGILFDFGCSSMQFDDPVRGFALSKDGPLDMRMDGGADGGFTAADVLAHAREDELHRIFKLYGDEKQSKKIARAIAQARLSYKPLTRTHELRDLVAATVNEEYRVDGLGRFSHPSTKVFQALRIFVNNELNEINYAMLLARMYLKIGGVMVAISFHSLEDTVVKSHVIGDSGYDRGALPLKFYNCNTTFDAQSLIPMRKNYWEAINKHVITPSPLEVDTNPRSRSAKLRAAIRVS